MELYDKTAKNVSRQLTLAYSTSFGLASRLFGRSIRNDIFAIYGLVRIADEIVDSYKKPDSGFILDQLENETYKSIDRQYSPNLIVHAFQQTANKYRIEKSLIKPFFASMRVDSKVQKNSLKNNIKTTYTVRRKW